MRLQRRYVIPAAIVVLLGGGTTAAVAAVAASPVSGNTIYGCYTNAAINGSHALVLQDAGTNCPRGTTAISWAVQGPAGPQGVPGATGPQGVPGATGPTGPPGGTVTDTTTATSTATVTVTPTTTPTLVASPVDTCANAVQLVPGAAGNSVSKTGVSVGNSYAWYEVVTGASASGTTITLADSGTPAASNDVMDVATDCAGANVATGATTFSGAVGTYFVKVYEGSGGTDGGFTITAAST